MIAAGDTCAIRTAGLARRFGDIAAVTSLDLEVNRGEMFALVGPDGAGKSTAIRLLCGILKPTGGSGQVLGFDLGREAEKIKAHIGYLSQSFTLYGDLTVDENIAFFADIHGVSDFRRRRDELLDFTRLTPFRRRQAQALSGGMKKKLALACTLVHTPDLIFLDEPSTGVDPVSRGEFWNILSGILAQGVTIFMTTPYLDEVERCHRIGMMHRGRVFVSGTPAEVKAALPGQVFRIDCPAAAAAYQALRAGAAAAHLVVYSDHLRLWTEQGAAEPRQVVEELNRTGLGPARFSPTEATLEDAFVGMVSAAAAEPVNSKTVNSER